MAGKKVAVLGAGDMGHGIAELAAINGYEVTIRDIKDDVLERAMQKVTWSLDKLAEHNTITKEQAEGAKSRLRTTVDLAEAVGDADFVIEAVPEVLDLKQKVFAEVEAKAPATCVLASNTSTMRMSDISAGMKNPERLVGMHFFNPVLLMQLVEVIPGERTPQDVVDAVTKLSEDMGKTVVVCHRDSAGFITSRLIGTWVGAAVKLHEEKVGTKEQIDAAMKFKAGFPMGPFELADYTGLDIGHHAAEYIASHRGDAYKPLPSLDALVEQGNLGKKTGRGFYEWQDNRMTTKLSAADAEGFDPALVMSVVANEAARLLDEGAGTPEEIDAAMRLGCAFPKGPLQWADQHGLDKVHATLTDLKGRYAHPMFEPAEPLVKRVEAGDVGAASGKGFYEHGAAEAGGAIAGKPQFDTILYDVDENGVATITMNRPHRLHAINDELLRDLKTVTTLVENDANVRAVVLTGSGEKAFCVGADLSDASDITPVSAVELARDMNNVCHAWERSGKVWIAAINGHAYGGGFELALACDFRLAAERAKLGLPEVTLGLIAASGGTQRITKLVGLARAKEIVLLGDKHKADEMAQWGLVHRLLGNDEFEEKVKEFATKVAKGAPIAQRLAKRSLRLSTDVANDEGAELEAAAFGLLMNTEDAMEGVSAMFMRTEPEFKGK